VAGLVPATHVFAKRSVKRKKAWMAGTRPATGIVGWSWIVNLSTNTGDIAADLLQVQPSATIGSIHDCRLEDTNRTTWMTPGRA